MMLVRIFKHVYRAEFSTVWRSVSQHAGQRLDIAGIYPPVATPFTRKGHVDYQSLENNIQKYGGVPFKGKHFCLVQFISLKMRFMIYSY